MNSEVLSPPRGDSQAGSSGQGRESPGLALFERELQCPWENTGAIGANSTRNGASHGSGAPQAASRGTEGPSSQSRSENAGRFTSIPGRLLPPGPGFFDVVCVRNEQKSSLNV